MFFVCRFVAGQTCNGYCSCKDLQPQPICSEDGSTYLNMCYAGCNTLELHTDTQTIVSIAIRLG